MLASHATMGHLRATGLVARLGAEIPVIAAPMAGGPTTPELVIAAARSGGLGFLAGGYKPVAQLLEQISVVRRATDRFGVNLFVPETVAITPDTFRQYAAALAPLGARYDIDLEAIHAASGDDGWNAKIDALVADPIPVVSFTFGIPAAGVIRRLQDVGSVVIQTVTSLMEAERAAGAGVDGLIVQGAAAGGHSATMTPTLSVEDVPLTVLVQRIATSVQLPVWAAGGVATAAIVRDVLDAGAEAAMVGTVLLRSDESGATALYKQALADPPQSETKLTKAFTGRPARALRNAFVDTFDSVAPDGYPALHFLTAPIRQAAAAAGDLENINIWAGTGYRYATSEPASAILRRLASNARAPAAPQDPIQERTDDMPLVSIDVNRGRSQQELRTLLDTIHGAMVEAFEVPESDRYQLLTQHDPEEMVALDTGLGIYRTNGLVILRFVSRKRPERAKLRLYELLVERLEAACGIRPEDVVVSITENGAADWSFGHGGAQFVTGGLR